MMTCDEKLILAATSDGHKGWRCVSNLSGPDGAVKPKTLFRGPLRVRPLSVVDIDQQGGVAEYELAVIEGSKFGPGLSLDKYPCKTPDGKPVVRLVVPKADELDVAMRGAIGSEREFVVGYRLLWQKDEVKAIRGTCWEACNEENV